MQASVSQKSKEGARQRLSREVRYRQLMDTAWKLVRDEGTDALTLGRLAEQSGVTKPVVYDHFSTRPGLLAALYKEHDVRQIELMAEALKASKATLSSRAMVIAVAYVDCMLIQGREISGVIAALASSPELEKLKQECEAVFLEKCELALAPFTKSGSLSKASMRAMLGAAEALAGAAANDEISADEAKAELAENIIAMVKRHAKRGDEK